MRRVWLMIAATALVTAFGCGRENYEKRLAKTIEKMKYDRRVSKELMPAGTSDKRFQDLSLWVQAPKDEALAKVCMLPGVSDGPYDLDASFNDAKANHALHVLARVKLPKKPPTKGAPPPPPPVARGDFTRDVLGVLSSLFGQAEGLDNPKFVEEKKRGNTFKRLIFTAEEKEIKVYTFKKDNTEAALIFVYDPKLRASLSSKIDLCLEVFKSGPRATQAFAGNGEEEGESSGPAGPM